MRASHSRAATVLHSFYYAFRGVRTGFLEERNFRVQCLYGAVVVLLLGWYRPSLIPSVTALLTVALLLAAELGNSALERVVDLVSPEANARAGEAKDLSAAAVMLVSFGSAITVLFVLKEHLLTQALIGVGGFFMWIIGRRFWNGGSF